MSSMVLCLFVLCVLLCSATAPLAAAGANLLKNGDFAVDSDGNGLADEWAFSGNATAVTATERREPLPQGGFAQGLICTHFVAGGADHHAMLAQYDTFALKKDHWYRLSFRAKGDLASTAAYAAIQQTAPTWETAGLNSPFRVHGEWRDISFTFRAARDVGPNVRLQIWFEETGELWLREVQLVEVESGETKAVEAYTDVLPDLGGRNLLPNGGFECGASGWGTMGEGVGWAGSGFNTLFGHVDKGTAPSPHGSSFRLDLDQATAPIASFDYLDVVEKKQLLPLLSNRGWIRVTPGEAYTLSAFVKADPAGTPALLRVYVAFRGWEDRAVTATGEWQRVSFTFRPSGDQIYVGVGPDLRASKLPRTTMWIGEVQLEKGEQATDYAPRAPIEIGLEWPHPGHLFFAPGEVQAFVTAFTAGPARTVRVQAEVTDFFDRVVDRPALELALQPGKAVRTPLPMHLHENGFYRLRLTAAEGAVIPTLAERFGVVAKPRDPNGLFGMNHAYSTNDLLRISRDFGLTWYRDWSLKWHQVEPEKGHFDFSKLEYHIDRVRKEGLNVLGLLPFPSSNWSGGAPGGEANTDMGEHARLAVRPTNLDDFATYVRTTVQHFQGRIRVWEVLNEPIYTGYALPKRSGYTTRDYVDMLAVAYREIKSVDPKAIVIGGIAGNPETETDEFIAAGGLDHLGAINLHIYPVFRLPETYDEPLRQLREKLGATGKPIYYTEGGYYGDDDLPTAPFAAGDSLMAPLESERECSAYQTRLNLILLAHGTRMFIVHAGTSGGLNDPSVGGIYFEWDGAPRKMAITLSVMNSLFGPDVAPVGTVWEDVRSPIFHSRGKTVVALWDEHRRHVTLTPRPGAQVFDIAGARVQGKTFEIDDCPYYVVLEGTRSEEEARAALGGWR